MKNSPANAGDSSSVPELGRCPGEENGNLTPAFLPGESHGQRSLAGYSPWCRKRVGHDLVTNNNVVDLQYCVTLSA